MWLNVVKCVVLKLLDREGDKEMKEMKEMKDVNWKRSYPFLFFGAKLEPCWTSAR